MCRIAGIISHGDDSNKLAENVKLMCKSLSHGGPDDEGIYVNATHHLAFGHRRLAIIDLSAKGHQPMSDGEQKIWITFNGEIYNYLELRQELKTSGSVFNTNTDTEVIIQAYQQWGEKAFGRFRGMFSFALFDETKKVTYLVRDTQGIKPLFYSIKDKYLSFASEVKAFNATDATYESDPDWPIRFLAYGHIPEPYTTLKNVLCLPKAHFLKWDHHTHLHSVLSYNLSHATNISVTNTEEAERLVKNTLDRAMQRQLLADAPLGVFLSGGIDSSLLTLLAYRYKKEQLKTVSILFDEEAFNEKQYQDLIITQTGILNTAHLVTEQLFNELLPDIIKAMDMPTTDGVNSWFISKYAHEEGLKAVISGLGGDELFGGYPSFKRIKYLKYLKACPNVVLNTVSKLSAGRARRLSLLTYRHPLAEYLFLRGIFTPNDISRILNISKQRVTDVLFADKLDLSNLNDEERAGWYEANLYMQNQLLRDTDVMSMAHGLEVRVPYLDEDFTRTIERITSGIKFGNGKPKQLLIDSNPGLLPENIWNRPKMGFSFPLEKWMRNHSHISNPEFYENGYAQEVIEKFKQGKVHWSKAFTLYQLALQNSLKTSATSKKVMLLSLETFSAAGGIQKMTRTLAKVLKQTADRHGWQFSLWSGYDSNDSLDSNYLDGSSFRGFNKKKKLFALRAIAEGAKSEVVILSHINLASIGWFVKLLRPRCQVWLIAHGIEVWRPLRHLKKLLLKKCDKIICVSKFTANQMVDLHNVSQNKLKVLNNALDPLIKLPAGFKKPDYLLNRYQLNESHKVIFTLTRLAFSEQYKGYEKVIEAISILKKTYPEIKYILGGKCDDQEQTRVENLIKKFGVRDNVIVTGYIAEAELVDHFLLADIFVLPSKKEGFGIVFIEALACGLPVICGNEDGSGDAIKDGELGTAINVNSVSELVTSIEKHFVHPPTADDKAVLQAKCLEYFNTDRYSNEIEMLLLDERG